MAEKLGVAAPGSVVLSNTATVLELKFTMAKSNLPSPLRSPTATDRGPSPVTKSCLTAKLEVAAPGVVVLSSTDTVAIKFATTRSSFPSPLKSPIATDKGLSPVGKSCLVAKLGVAAPGAVVFSSTDTVLELILATARSSFPSRFRSATVTNTGPVPVVKSCLGAKVDVADPGTVVLSNTDTVFEAEFATTRSSLPTTSLVQSESPGEIESPSPRRERLQQAALPRSGPAEQSDVERVHAAQLLVRQLVQPAPHCVDCGPLGLEGGRDDLIGGALLVGWIRRAQRSREVPQLAGRQTSEVAVLGHGAGRGSTQ